MTEENRAPPGHQYRAGCRMSADRALARHVGVAAFIVNNNPETMEGEPAIVSHTRRLPFTTPPPELARMVGGPHPSRRAHARRTWIFSNRALLRMRTDGRMLNRGSLQNRSPSSIISRCQTARGMG